VGNVENDRPVLFFDGECNLCNAAIYRIIRMDKRQIFLFAPLQSEAGKNALAQLKGAPNPESVVLFSKGKYYIQSDAILHTCRLSGGFWSLLFGGIILPRFIRDWIYKVISQNRYRWFGKRPTCMVPAPELKSRFLK